MKRVEIHLKDEERETLKTMCSSGVASVRILQRAPILLALDQGIVDQQIAAVLQVERTRIWRVRQRYLEQQLKGALYDQPRSGRPTEYGDSAEAELVALACSKPPTGYSQWSLPLLTQGCFIVEGEKPYLTDWRIAAWQQPSKRTPTCEPG